MTHADGIHIRPERPEEFPAIYALVKTAFATARVSDGSEQDFVNSLRAGPNYIPELALAAEEKGTLIGHIMLTRLPFTAKPGSAALSPLLLAPLCVRLESRSLGVGATLTREAFHRAGALGFTAVFLLGDISYYGRFGFRRASEYGVAYSPSSLPDAHTLACELVPGALGGVHGTVHIL